MKFDLHLKRNFGHFCSKLSKYSKRKTLLYLVLIICLVYVLIIYYTSEVLVDEVPSNDNFAQESFPKVIHQVWLNYRNQEIPKEWTQVSKETINMNTGWEHRIWRDKDVMDLFRTNYPWFIETFHSYKYDVERVDAARYFIVLHHGGVYLDMDEYSKKPLDEIIQEHNLQNLDCLLPGGTPSGVTTYAFMCKKGSPFLAYITARLRHYNGWYGIPYASVMWSTGPRFISGRYNEYNRKETLYVLPNEKVLEYFGCLFGQTWFSVDGIIIHALAYPFVRLAVSWAWLILIPICIFLILVRRHYKHRKMQRRKFFEV